MAGGLHRAISGIVVVLGAAFIAQHQARDVDASQLFDVDDDPRSIVDMPWRFAKALARYVAVVVPESLVAVSVSRAP